MSITFRNTECLNKAAGLTFDNMRSYYERYGVSWDSKIIEGKTADLDNYDILIDNEVVGVFRLQYEIDCCYLRDIQIKPSHQNLGIGQLVLNEVKRRTQDALLATIKLRVFKISPAVGLYKRNGFVIENEDERFLNLKLDLSC
ncbi:GNAT family N-acetyltransferase [Glaciecola sp. MF2-115]|uniref:GNAT family N-acetyltransferase n=1 Tax=Glaciecola sp. MF2-115 TaxID=3384827 RepID=UPI0039A243CA